LTGDPSTVAMDIFILLIDSSDVRNPIDVEKEGGRATSFVLVRH
jgi:hypothetical protein